MALRRLFPFLIAVLATLTLSAVPAASDITWIWATHSIGWAYEDGGETGCRDAARALYKYGSGHNVAIWMNAPLVEELGPEAAPHFAAIAAVLEQEQIPFTMQVLPAFEDCVAILDAAPNYCIGLIIPEFAWTVYQDPAATVSLVKDVVALCAQRGKKVFWMEFSDRWFRLYDQSPELIRDTIIQYPDTVVPFWKGCIAGGHEVSYGAALGLWQGFATTDWGVNIESWPWSWLEGNHDMPTHLLTRWLYESIGLGATYISLEVPWYSWDQYWEIPGDPHYDILPRPPHWAAMDVMEEYRQGKILSPTRGDVAQFALSSMAVYRPENSGSETPYWQVDGTMLGPPYVAGASSLSPSYLPTAVYPDLETGNWEGILPQNRFGFLPIFFPETSPDVLDDFPILVVSDPKDGTYPETYRTNYRDLAASTDTFFTSFKDWLNADMATFVADTADTIGFDWTATSTFAESLSAVTPSYLGLYSTYACAIFAQATANQQAGLTSVLESPGGTTGLWLFERSGGTRTWQFTGQDEADDWADTAHDVLTQMLLYYDRGVGAPEGLRLVYPDMIVFCDEDERGGTPGGYDLSLPRGPFDGWLWGGGVTNHIQDGQLTLLGHVPQNGGLVSVPSQVSLLQHPSTLDAAALAADQFHLRLALDGQGALVLQINSGAFPIVSGQLYLVVFSPQSGAPTRTFFRAASDSLDLQLRVGGIADLLILPASLLIDNAEGPFMWRHATQGARFYVEQREGHGQVLHYALTDTQQATFSRPVALDLEQCDRITVQVRSEGAPFDITLWAAEADGDLWCAAPLGLLSHGRWEDLTFEVSQLSFLGPGAPEPATIQTLGFDLSCDWPAALLFDEIRAQALKPGPQVLLDVHPNEQAPGAAGPGVGDPYSTAPGAVSTGGYTWKTYNFAGSPYLWIQVCAQAQRASNTPSGIQDRLQMLVDGVNLSDYWADNMAAPPNYQWNGSFALDMGRRKTLRFLSMGVPGMHAIRFKAVQYPIIWWIKVTDLEPQVIEPPE